MSEPIEDNQAARRCDVVRLAASQSFSEREVLAMEQMFTRALAGGDVRKLLGSPEIANVVRKVGRMKAAIERQKVRRAQRASEMGSRDPQRNGGADG